MLPASFAPMILKLILPKVSDHFMKVFKLDKVLKYVEQENDADKEIARHKEHITMLAGEFSDLDARIKKLEILSKKTKKTNGK